LNLSKSTPLKDGRVDPSLILLTVVIFGVLIPFQVVASPLSKDLITKGQAFLNQHEFEAGLLQFEAAVQADPTDPEAIFFLGAALNRLGHQDQALPLFEQAQALGATHPDLNFEIAWSLLATGRFQKAIGHFEQYENLNPGRGQTSEFLGRAYFGLGKEEKAQAAFEEAIRRDPTLTPTVQFALTLIEQSRKNSEGASRHFQAIFQEGPDSPLSRVLRERLQRLTGPSTSQSEKPWRLAVSAGGGFNSNVLALGDGIPLPSDISSKGSGFGSFTADGSYTWEFNPTTVTAGYGFLANVYGGVSTADLMDHLFSINIRHLFTPQFQGAFLVTDNFTQIGGTNFRNQVAIRPSVAYRLAEWAMVDLAYAFSSSDYLFPTFFPVTGIRERDSHTHTVTPSLWIRIPFLELLVRLGYFHIENQADGSDFDYDADGMVITLQRTLFWNIMGNVQYTLSYADYHNLNSFAGTFGFAFAREDETEFFSMSIRRPLNDLIPFAPRGLQGYVRFEYTNNDSNVSFFNYDQLAGLSGVLIEF